MENTSTDDGATRRRGDNITMPVLPKFILTKFTIKSEVIGVYNTLEDAKMIKDRCKMVEDNGIKYEIFEVIKDATVNNSR